MSLAMKFDDANVIEKARARLTEYLPLRPHFAADFHPLTAYGVADTEWIGWQYHVPDSGEGLVQLFRRAKTTSNAMQVRFRGLQPEARYRLTIGEKTWDESGAKMAEGWTVHADAAPAAVVVRYLKLPASR